MSSADRAVRVYDLGTTSYREVHGLQRKLQARRGEGGGEDTLLLTEHRPVITLGRSHPTPDLRVGLETIANYGIDIVATERGGDITYHGPGQLVAYGIIDLKGWGATVQDYIDGLEDAVMGVLGDWGVEGSRNPRARGVWIGERKIASLGLNVRRWVTMHGIALNIATDLGHFDLINPCGMPDVEMTTLSLEVGKRLHPQEVVEPFVFHFARVFACKAEFATLPTAGLGAARS